jgi:hypothetical protein
MSRTALLLLATSALTRAAPTPCSAPPNVVPVVPEGLCYTEVAPVNPSGVSIRRYGVGPLNATLATGIGNGAFLAGVQSSAARLLTYFQGGNDEQRDILAARTVPMIITPPHAGDPYATYTASIEVSPTQFPDNFLIPRPNPQTGVSTSLVSANFGLMAVFGFNTSGFPYQENFQEACGAIQDSTLPSGYAINTTNAYSPSYVFYNGQTATDFTCECWMAVYKM